MRLTKTLLTFVTVTPIAYELYVPVVCSVPVIVEKALAILASNCVWIPEVTPSKYPNSVEVTAETAILPEPSEAKALEAVRSEVVTEDIAPAILLVLRVSKAVMLVAFVTVLEETVPI